MVVAAAVLVLPLLLWAHTALNLQALGVLLHQGNYSRATFDVTEYGHWTEGAGEFMRTQHYFHGTVAGRHETMPVTFARYSPALAAIMDAAPRGRTPLELSIDVWYNPDMRRSWLAREHAILPDAPDFFRSLYAGLGVYALLWIVFAGIWLMIVLLPRSRRGAPAASRELIAQQARTRPKRRRRR